VANDGADDYGKNLKNEITTTPIHPHKSLKPKTPYEILREELNGPHLSSDL
jgi:predicted RNA binding protein YcfA (HicA-like mRNA interferase family)